MPWQNTNSQNYANQNQSSGDKKRTNFPVGRLFGSDGKLNVTIWNSDSAVYTIIAIAQSVGKDPTTGANVYEQKAPNELPRVFLNPENLETLLLGMSDIDINGTTTHVLPLKNGSKLTIAVNNGKVTLTTETQKQGSRSITFEPITFASSNINGNWNLFKKYLTIASNKALVAKLDPNEFAMVMGQTTSDEEVPV
jgi:outer membrane protein assembly factor BamB